MIWDDVQLGAKRKGEIEFALDQSQTAVLTQPGPWGNAYSGFCAGLAVRWIWLRYGNTDYPFDPRTRELEMPDWQATREQNIYEDATGDWKAKYTEGCRVYGMTINLGRVREWNLTATGEMLRSAALAGPGCYIISIRRAGGGHAVAMQSEDGTTFRFFDANYGEFVLKGAVRFARFIDEYWSETGYKLKYNAATRVGGVNPPPPSSYAGGGVKELARRFGG